MVMLAVMVSIFVADSIIVPLRNITHVASKIQQENFQYKE